jgi:hypothetical protein
MQNHEFYKGGGNAEYTQPAVCSIYGIWNRIIRSSFFDMTQEDQVDERSKMLLDAATTVSTTIFFFAGSSGS